MLSGECLDYRPKSEWWAYQWCFKDKIEQHHYERHQIIPAAINAVGEFKGETVTESDSVTQTYQHKLADCQIEGSEEKVRRTATVNIYCCMVDHSSPSNKKRLSKSDNKHGTFIEHVEETTPCNYLLKVCSELICTEEMKENIQKQMERNQQHTKQTNHQTGKGKSHSKAQKGNLQEKANPPPAEESILPTKPNFQYSFTAENNGPVSREEQKELKNRVKDMFYHGYNSYMDNAYPEVRQA